MKWMVLYPAVLLLLGCATLARSLDPTGLYGGLYDHFQDRKGEKVVREARISARMQLLTACAEKGIMLPQEYPQNFKVSITDLGYTAKDCGKSEVWYSKTLSDGIRRGGIALPLEIEWFMSLDAALAEKVDKGEITDLQKRFLLQSAAMELKQQEIRQRQADAQTRAIQELSFQRWTNSFNWRTGLNCTSQVSNNVVYTNCN